LKRCFDTWYSEFGLINGVHYVVDKIPPTNWPKLHIKMKSYENTICFNNGCMVFTTSLDNYKAIDGTEFGWAELDETKDTREEAIKEVIVARLRQSGMWVTPDGHLVDYETSQSHNPLSIFTSPAKVLWINEWFGMPDYYEDINQIIFSKTEFFKRNTDRDFNVVPYISATISQIYLSDGIYYVETQREYALSAPHNNSEDLSNRILLDFQNHKGGCFIYGDASGANRQTVSKTHKHNYSVIESILKPLLHPNSNRVTKRNPPLIKRRDFANKLFAEGYPIRQIIDPSCKHLITDFEFIKEAPDGGKLKEKVKDSNTGETYEKLGHLCDNWDYLVCAAFDMYFSPK
jgi:hypothetical protein